jgi:hypothetical protein
MVVLSTVTVKKAESCGFEPSRFIREGAMFWLQVTAAVAGGIATVVCFAWYAKSKNKGHLFMALCNLLVAGVFGYLALS